MGKPMVPLGDSEMARWCVLNRFCPSLALGACPNSRCSILSESDSTALEADARLAAAEERRIEAEKEQQRQAEGRKKPGKPAAPPSDQPDPKSQRNFTDPESRIMKSKDGFVQTYNERRSTTAASKHPTD
jgi:hypothetical protein